jgi:hypothetical protein
MSVVMYIIGGAAIAAGALTAGRCLLSLTTGPARASRLRRAARIRPTASPGGRGRAWSDFGIAAGSVLTGALLLLSVDDAAVRQPAAVAVTVVLAGQLGAMFTSRARRRSAS